MRGCLFTLLLGATAIWLFVVLGLPAIAAGVLTTGVGAAGLHADDTTVTVSSDPPTDLLGLHADRVHLTASDATFRDLRIGSLDVTLAGMSLTDRTAEAVDGRLRDVVVADVGGSPLVIDTIRLGGGGDAITAAATIPGSDVEGLIADAIERRLNIRPSSVTLSAPDGLTVDAGGGATVEGRLQITGSGDLVVRITSGPAKGQGVVLIAGSALPMRLTDVGVTAGGDLRLAGELAVGLFG